MAGSINITLDCLHENASQKVKNEQHNPMASDDKKDVDTTFTQQQSGLASENQYENVNKMKEEQLASGDVDTTTQQQSGENQYENVNKKIKDEQQRPVASQDVDTQQSGLVTENQYENINKKMKDEQHNPMASDDKKDADDTIDSTQQQRDNQYENINKKEEEQQNPVASDDKKDVDDKEINSSQQQQYVDKNTQQQNASSNEYDKVNTKTGNKQQNRETNSEYRAISKENRTEEPCYSALNPDTNTAQESKSNTIQISRPRKNVYACLCVTMILSFMVALACFIFVIVGKFIYS